MNNATCDYVTGTCYCSIGFKGIRCDQGESQWLRGGGGGLREAHAASDVSSDESQEVR